MMLQKSQMVFVFSSLLLISWVIMIINVRPIFLETASIDPLAMIHALFPLFWVIVIAYAMVCLAIFYFDIEGRFLHSWVLVQLSLILFYTPFALAGYAVNPDSLWLATEANYLPTIFSGGNVMFSTYTETYPSSFILTRYITEVTGMNAFAFTRIFPIFSIVLLTLLAYAFGSSFLKPRIAFIAMLLVLPGWHYMDFHMSPHVTGALLFFTILVLFASLKNSRVKITGLIFISMIAMIIAHPVSPINLGIFIAVVYVLEMFSRKLIHASLRPFSVTGGILLFLGVGWFNWMVNHVIPLDVTIEYAFRRVASLQFSRRIVGEVGSFSVGGGSFIYPDIFRLTELIYASYILIGFLLVLYGVISLKLKKRASGLNLKVVTLFAAAICYVAFSYFLLLGTGDHHLLYRGLIPFILMISLVIGWHLVRSQKRGITLIKITTLAYVVFLFSSFAIVAYSLQAYNSFPYSEGVAAKFVGEQVGVQNKTVSMTSDQQLAPYIDLTGHFSVAGFPPRINESRPDVIVVLRSSYYVYAMRYDLSFSQNRVVNLRNQLEVSVFYDPIYSNPTSQVYVLKP